MEYKHWKWDKYGTNNIKKTSRQTLDMREETNIEEEMVNKCDNVIEAENKREICSKRITNRNGIIQSNINPFLSNNNYLEDINNEMTFLRPKDSNYTNRQMNK
jgi:hypothetical protein